MKITMRVLAWLSLLGAGAAGAQTVCDAVKKLVADPLVASAHWGVSVTTLDGTTVCAVNEGQFFRPASNNKIFTSATALALLGPEKRFTTSVVAEGTLTATALHGSLLLVGGGDANFGGHDIPYVPPALRPKNPPAEPPTIADIEALAAKIAASGLKTIDGDIVGDDTQIAWEPYPPDWTLDDAVYGYGAPVSALAVHDNQLVVEVAPGAASARALVTTVPAVPYYTLDNKVYTTDLGHDCDARLAYRRAPGSKLLTVFGDIPPNPVAGAQPCRQAVAIADPAEYAALALKLALERRGIKITGIAKARHSEMRRLGSATVVAPDVHFMLPRMLEREGQPAPVECQAQRTTHPGAPPDPVRTVLATHDSPALKDDVTYTLKVSQNMHAELMLRNLGVAFSCEHSQSSGLTVIREYLLHAGVAPEDFVLYDGSGLSAHDLVTPRAFTTFLRFAAAQPWFESWKAALPGGGTDGTLANRFGKTLNGRVFAKTGTLSESRALSGYVVADSGKTLVFSVMVDTHNPATGDDRAVMDRIVQAVAAQE